MLGASTIAAPSRPKVTRSPANGVVPSVRRARNQKNNPTASHTPNNNPKPNTGSLPSGPRLSDPSSGMRNKIGRMKRPFFFPTDLVSVE